MMSTMKESTRLSSNGSVGPGGAVRSVSAPKVSDYSDVPSDAITFEVLYTGKLRMSTRKAPSTFVDDALAKFKSHENEKGRRESVVISYSRRSSSQVIITIYAGYLFIFLERQCPIYSPLHQLISLSFKSANGVF